MKKIIVLLTGLILATGCTKNMTCTKEEVTDGIKDTTKIITRYNDKEIKKLELVIDMELVDEQKTNQTEFEFLTSYTKNFYDGYIEEGIDIKETKEDKKYNLKISYDQDKMNNIKRILNVDLSSGAKLKKALEREKYVCQ